MDRCWFSWPKPLTHWGSDKMDTILQMTISSPFSWMKIYEFRLKFHWNFFLRVQLTIFHHWFRWMLDTVQVTSHCLSQWWLVYWCIYASLGLNEFKTIFEWIYSIIALFISLFYSWETYCISKFHQEFCTALFYLLIHSDIIFIHWLHLTHCPLADA